MKKAIVLIFALTLTVGACAAFKQVVKTVNTVATDLCWVFAEQHPDALGGLLPAQWCEIKENVDPFIEYVLKAQQDGVAKD